MPRQPTIFQSSIWEKFQNTLPGRDAGSITQDKNTLHWVVVPSVLEQKYLYINHGPNHGKVSDFWPQILSIAKQKKCAYIKVEPLNFDEETPLDLRRLGLRPSKYNIQPCTTLALDLTKTETEILKQMKPKGRYNIKIAAKHNIKYQEFDGQSIGLNNSIDQFYHLLSTTATRDHFGIHSREYYELFLEKLYPHSKLYLAYHGDIVIAGLIATFYQGEGIYYYGASSNQDRETMATYGLQWHVIQSAKKQGAITYDFLGIAPENSTKNHPWYGVTAFKKKFGGQIIQYPGTYHYICNFFVYFLIHAPKKLVYIARRYLHITSRSV